MTIEELFEANIINIVFYYIDNYIILRINHLPDLTYNFKISKII